MGGLWSGHLQPNTHKQRKQVEHKYLPEFTWSRKWFNELRIGETIDTFACGECSEETEKKDGTYILSRKQKILGKTNWGYHDLRGLSRNVSLECLNCGTKNVESQTARTPVLATCPNCQQSNIFCEYKLVETQDISKFLD